MDTFGERLRDAMLVAGKSKTAVARHCGVSRQTVAKWLVMREAELSGVHLAAVCPFLRCRMLWLAVGAGSSELISTDPEIAALVTLAKRMQHDR